MNRTRLMLIGVVALAMGGLVSFVVYHNLEAKTPADNRPGVNIVVAADDLQVGAKIEDRDVRVARFPEGELPQGVYHAPSQVVGRGVVLPISRGEFILPGKLAGENAGFGLPALIPPGMRAVSVRVNEVVSVAGFVQPGTRVDVLVTGNPGAGETSEQTTTVLENVAVIATGQRLEHNSGGDAQVAPVITLLVSPDDAQKLTLASSQGRIQLALRNPLDTRQEDLNGIGPNSIYRGVPAPKPVAAQRPVTVAKHVAPAAPQTSNAYTVEVIKGDKKEETDFGDKDKNKK
ncbi:MAG TPA: Flp pilus assembly protein CpaB [Bryobacteraceae bacterium]|nr:Flp pilus assembly protein CpaB [Bryobacteraceae bacterium]